MRALKKAPSSSFLACSTPKRRSFSSSTSSSFFFFFSHPLVAKSKKSKNSYSLSYRYVEAEKTNGRWAMIGVAGILGQEILGVEPKWFLHGQKDYGKQEEGLFFLFRGFFFVFFFFSFSKNLSRPRPLPSHIF